ncbi:hypothetical protein [Staphylococcus hominis]|nr:hypothetical protein [Staphylococcus hominis]MDS3909634.1 hypothetical protein [Staphylococcus hominis]
MNTITKLFKIDMKKFHDLKGESNTG